MSAHLLVMYPHPADVREFERAYRCVAPKLPHATGVATKRAIGPSKTPYHLIWDVTFPTAVDLLACVLSPGGRRALAQVAAISTGGAPSIIAVVEDSPNQRGQR